MVVIITAPIEPKICEAIDLNKKLEIKYQKYKLNLKNY